MCLPTSGNATTVPICFVYLILTLNFGAATLQKLRDIKDLYWYNFYHFIAPQQKIFDMSPLNCYDIKEQSASLTQAGKFHIAVVASNRRHEASIVCYGSRIAAYR